MSRLTVNYAEIEDHVKHNEAKEFMYLAKFYKSKGCYQEMLEMHYNSDKSTLFHLMARYCKMDLVRQFFDYTEILMGKNYLTYELNTKLDRNGRTFVIIAAKHMDVDVLTYLLKDYDLDPGFYAAYNKSSALTYLIKRRLRECSLKALSMIDSSKLSQDGVKWFQDDMERLKDTFTEQELVKERWIRAMTYKHEITGRVSKMIASTTIEKTSFSGQNRLRQLMRHIASQLFFRWKFHNGVSELIDVQLLYMVKTVDKDNLHPKPVIFVACTPLEAADYIKEDFKTRSLKEMLLKEYPCHNDEEAQKRNKRFLRKMETRIFSTRVTKQSKESREVVNLLLADKKKVQKTIKLRRKVKMPFLDLTENSFYLVIPGGNYDAVIHAEEALCDISKHLDTAWDHKTIIFGKNRSCLSCCGRMKAIEAKYNEHQGHLHAGLMQYQDEDATEETLALILQQPSYLTIRMEKKEKEISEEKTEYMKDSSQVVAQTEPPPLVEEIVHLKHYDTASDSDDDGQTDKK